MCGSCGQAATIDFGTTIIKDSFGTFDLLKTISSAPALPYSRDNRWTYFGLVNEPASTRPTGPDPHRSACGWTSDAPTARPIHSPIEKISGRQDRARAAGAGLPVGSYYGEPTGIVGLRLFPNPDFDEAARKPLGSRAVLQRPNLLPAEGPGAALSRRHVMRVLSCRARARRIRREIPKKPKWANLNSTVGAQYFRVDRIFVWNADQDQRHLPDVSTPIAPARSIPRWSPPTISSIRAR